MDNKNICQSCSMPLTDNNLLGTEKDGSKSHSYCKYCYRDGAFLNPGLTIDQMSSFMKWKMKEMKMDDALIDNAVKTLPFLMRWKQQPRAV